MTPAQEAVLITLGEAAGAVSYWKAGPALALTQLTEAGFIDYRWENDGWSYFLTPKGNLAYDIL